MTWRKLEVGNDWGALYYTYAGERLNDRVGGAVVWIGIEAVEIQGGHK